MTICSDANLLFFSAKCFRPSSGDGGDTFSLAYRRRMFKRRPQCDSKEKWRAGWCLTGLRNNKGKEVGPNRAPPASIWSSTSNIFIFFVNLLSIMKLMLANKKFISGPRRGLLPPSPRGGAAARRLVIVGAGHPNPCSVTF